MRNDYQVGPSNFQLCMMCGLILALWAWVSNSDYQDAKLSECARQGLVWDSGKDVCVKFIDCTKEEC